MNAKQQKIHNWHLTDRQAMATYVWPLPVPDDLWEPLRLLTNFLNVAEVKELHRQLQGGNLRYKRNVLLHWYDLVEARENLLNLDRQCREMSKPKNWLRGRPSLADRLDAVGECERLGMVVEREGWTMDVTAVRIV